MPAFHVILRGRARGAGEVALEESQREFVVHDQDSPASAERTALKVARESGIEHAYVVSVRPHSGVVRVPGII